MKLFITNWKQINIKRRHDDNDDDDDGNLNPKVKYYMWIQRLLNFHSTTRKVFQFF